MAQTDGFFNLGPVSADLPDWVPEIAITYLSHTTLGVPIRQIAREKGCHASTISRQVQKCEALRDDPLVDQAYDNVARRFFTEQPKQENPQMTINTTEADAKRILRRLCETGAYLLASKHASKAAVFRDDDSGQPHKITTVERETAYGFALQEWISGKQIGDVGRYSITSVGRAALKRMLAGGSFADQHKVFETRNIKPDDGSPAQPLRYNLAESPLALLGRRRGQGGTAFLAPEQIEAGERLREDFELAQMGPRVAQNWDRFLTCATRGGFNGNSPAEGPAAARARVSAALGDLGPGLADIAFRVCCFLDGLEKAEKRLGWSARSGKVVLRIALQRLARHYGIARQAESKMAS